MLMKISKHIEFPIELNIKNYLSNGNQNDTIYDLFAVLVH